MVLSRLRPSRDIHRHRPSRTRPEPHGRGTLYALVGPIDATGQRPERLVRPNDRSGWRYNEPHTVVVLPQRQVRQWTNLSRRHRRTERLHQLGRQQQQRSRRSLPCPVRNVQVTGAITFNYNNSGIVGDDVVCSTIFSSGAQDDFYISGANKNFVQNLYVNDTGNKAAGWAVDAPLAQGLDLTNLTIDHPYSGVKLFDFNDVRIHHLRVLRFFSQQGNIVSMSSDASGNACCGDFTDLYGYSAGASAGDESTGQAPS